MNLAHLLARCPPERAAVSLGADVVHSYGALQRRVGALARILRADFTDADGARVAVVMRNRPEYFEALFAAWHAGLAVVPINAKLHPKELAFILEHSGARVCLTDTEHRAAVLRAGGDVAILDVQSEEYAAALQTSPAPMRDHVRGDDLAWLFYTSGTTGRPKGAVLSHRNLVSMVMNYFADVDTVAARDCMIHAAPLSHGSGLYALPHVARAAINVVPASGGFDPDEIFELLPHHPGASMFLAPTMVHRLVRAPRAADADTRNLKTIVYGGGPMYVEDLRAGLALFGPKFVQIYGQGEAPMTITALSREDHGIERLHASAGRPRTDVEVCVVDTDGKQLPAGKVGEVACRGDVVMGGYWGDPDATARTLRHGWLHTGDLGCFDEGGYLTLKGRSGDMIISGGTNIYPREVEDVLLQHPGVLEVAVVGRPHVEWGEEVVAFIVAGSNRPPEGDLDTWCLDNIARFKRPRVYVFVDALPKNNNGKVIKAVLRDRAGTGSGPGEYE